MVSITRNMLEGFVREGSFKWLLGNRSLFDDEFEEMAKSPNSRKNWITELSPVANVVVRRCSRILEIPSHELRSNFDEEASDSLKHPLKYARNFLEYCCFRALALSTQVIGHLSDKAFRRLTYDMMLAWELPAASSQPLVKLDDECSVGGEAFSRIAPAIPTIADVIICDNLFDVLTASTGGRLRFSMYEKYLVSLERAIRKYKSQSESSLLSDIRSKTGEKILEVDGTVTTQPVLQHVGVSTWPGRPDAIWNIPSLVQLSIFPYVGSVGFLTVGRLILTDHALYFEDLRVVVSYDKAKIYDLSGELKQVVKPVLTGPWGTKLFDKAVMYNSLLLSEPVVMEFPELKGHSRRDYWLAIIREILYAHKFVRKFQIKGVERDDALLKAVLGILRLQALQEMPVLKPLRYEALLLFNLCDQLPGGDLILETLARMLASQVYDRANNLSDRSTMYSVSALAMMSNLGLAFGRSSTVPSEAGLFVGDIVVGELSALESAVRESRNSFKKVELAQASIDGAKMEGLDINLAVMEELLFPIIKLGKSILFLESWDDPVKSMVFCSVTSYIIYKGWMGLSFALLILFIAIFMLLNRWFNKGRPIYELKVMAPPAMNTMEQLLKLQNAISQLEELVQDGNVVLLKLRALSLSVFPKASEKLALGLVAIALVLAFLPSGWAKRERIPPSEKLCPHWTGLCMEPWRGSSGSVDFMKQGLELGRLTAELVSETLSSGGAAVLGWVKEG
ncbi:hypothetical protein IFM89_004084 [Coptis chinensis]|uniref:Uncharacterized protein n=1 Tax=Coptis chinensis TaxID=261450 RepID=A0A835LGY8_9MAGN|nr:hypothetical protein IFM89_004084 [Coptis chinensis]